MDFSLNKIFTIPNFFSFLRIALVPVVGWLLFLDTVESTIWAGVWLFAAIVTDFLDGFFARLLNQKSDLGRIIDPLADKLFIIFIGIVFIFLRNFPIWLTGLIVIKDLGIMVAGMLAMKHKNIVMESNMIGKYTFAFQAILVFSYFLRFDYGIWFYTILTVIFIFLSMFSYVKAYLDLTSEKEKKPPLQAHHRQLVIYARRIVVTMLAIIYMVHLFYWALENNELPEESRDLPAVNNEMALQLASQHAPILHFSQLGNIPVFAESMPSDGVMMQGKRYFLSVLDKKQLDFPLVEGTIPIEGSEHMYIIPGKSDSHSPEMKPPVYCHVKMLPDNDVGVKVVIQYWLLFRHESAPFPRIGDWQLFSVYLDTEHNAKFYLVTQSWNAESKRADSITDHIRIFVGERSNALFFEPGKHPLFLDQEKKFSCFSDNSGNGHVLIPEKDYQLKLLSGEESWLMWKGHWGGPMPAGDRGPRYWNPKDKSLSAWNHPVELLKKYLVE